MKVIILAGGFGTRISEFTEFLPKPMIQIGGRPIIWHIMNTYSFFGHTDFIIALGYKPEVIKDYFLDYRMLNSDFSIDLSTGVVTPFNLDQVNWKVSLVDTGFNTMTGGRIKRLKDFVGNDTCMITYGDGLSDIDISELLSFHRSHGKLVTVTAVRPSARFGELKITSGNVTSFAEKPQLHSGWINGGYFVVEPEFFDFIEGDSTMLEREPLEKAVLMNELAAFKHHGFWQCMDTKRDHQLLEKLWTNNAPWRH